MDILAWYWTGLGPEGTTRRAITGFAGSKRGVSSLLGDPKSRLLWAAPECVFLGEPVIADWSSDPRAGGSYSLIGPGQKAGLAVMRVPFGRVCLAGEHVNGTGTIDGAIRSGEVAAGMVLERRVS
jgi:hypothetical protein